MNKDTTPTSPLPNQQEMFRLWLQRQFADRCKKNAKYSLRSFAKYLNTDPSTLSQILSGKRKVSSNLMQVFCQKLSVTPADVEKFGFLETANRDASYFQLSLDMFTTMSEWHHYAILELTFVAGFQSHPQWIAKTLSISVQEAKDAVERLQRLGLLLEENGRLIKSSRMVTNASSVATSSAHKELQRQVLNKALSAIEECPQENKDITSMTMAIDVKNLDKARTLIRRFRRDLCELLEEGDQQVVYNLGIQLYPISEKRES